MKTCIAHYPKKTDSPLKKKKKKWFHYRVLHSYKEAKKLLHSTCTLDKLTD